MIDAAPGAIGRYTILGELGRGATGSVYLARDAFADRNVAIKVFRHAGENPTLGGQHRSAFLTEAALVGKLTHPHIVALLDAAVEQAHSYVVMEHVPGGTLEQYTSMDALLPLERVVEVVFKCSRALEYAHRMGIIHRDIKPANILVTREFDVKLSDFGVAQLTEATHTNIGNAGSPAYMSPEQLTERELTHQTDIYSLGVVMFQLLAGRLPFTASSQASLMYQIVNHDPPSLSSLRTDLPPAFDAIVARAMQKDLAQRYQNWIEFGRDLAALFRDLEAPREDFTETRKFHLLRNLSFFRDFRDVEIWETLRIAAWNRAAADGTLIREGDRGDSFFILVDGRAEVTRAGHELASLGPGDCFGEMLYFSGESALRSTTIRSSTPVLVLEIKAAALSAASDACQVQFNKSFMRILIERLTAANKRLTER
ncbi:MAG: protein kinase [Betaproteobacteria bacterium]|nr:protein kinase [Betaproteobacteria bacterium]